MAAADVVVDPGSMYRQLTLPSQRKPDVFDQEDFDAIKFINQIYPDETSLGDMDRFITVLKKQITSVDKEIFQAVRAQGGAHTRAKQDLSVAQAQIQDLFGRIQDIQRKAEESEAMVQEICRDIKKLDYAKRHLTNAITALRRLAMLTAAVTELEALGSRRDQYRKCANLVEAVHQLMEYFQQYETIPKVKSLTRRLLTVQSALQESVIDDFKILMGASDIRLTADNLDRLANACLVINALGPKVRDQLMDWLCDREMTIYQAIFSMSGEAAKLDRFERRFQWFRSRMEEKKDQWAIFPDEWRVPQVLCLTFCKITKAHLKRILSDDEAEVRVDIAPLVRAVVTTNKFEKEMAAAFGGGSADDADEDDEAHSDTMTASEARRRLEKFRMRAKAEANKKAPGQVDKAREAQQAVKTAFEGSISDAFEPSLRFYVAEEEKDLLSQLETAIKEEHERKWLPAEDEQGLNGTHVLQSANKVFFRIRASFTRCSRMISKGHTLLSLALVFQRVLGSYAAELLRRLPRTATGQTSVMAPYVGTDWHIRVADDEEKVVCHILHTAEFCRETMEGLAAAVHKDLKAPLGEQLDLSEEESAFMNVSGQAMSVLVLGVNTRLDAALVEMARVRWDTIEQPGDDSPFIHTARKVLLDCAPRLGMELDRANFSFFCEKMGRMFLPRFQEAIFRLRRISEKGTLQLSIDADSMRRMLLDFPKVARPMDLEPDVPGYSHYVEREMGSAVNMVKVLQSKPENLVATFALLMPASEQTVADFTRLLEMKALTKKQQQDLLALFQRKASLDPHAGVPSPGDAAPKPGGLHLGASPLGNALLSGVMGGLGSMQRAAGSGFEAAAGGFGRGGGGASGGAGQAAVPPAAAVGSTASNLGAFKLNMNNFTRELASSINFQGRGARAGSEASTSIPAKPGGIFGFSATGGGGGGGSHQRTGSGSGTDGLLSGAAAAAGKAKEGLARFGLKLSSGSLTAQHDDK